MWLMEDKKTTEKKDKPQELSEIEKLMEEQGNLIIEDSSDQTDQEAKEPEETHQTDQDDQGVDRVEDIPEDKESDYGI